MPMAARHRAPLLTTQVCEQRNPRQALMSTPTGSTRTAIERQPRGRSWCRCCTRGAS